MKNQLFISLFFASTLLLTNCKQEGTAALPPDLTGFTTTSIAGGMGVKAEKINEAGGILEEGTLVNGARNGAWVTYYPDEEKVIKTLVNYVDNELNGVYLTFSNRGQIETLTTYANGVFDGNYAKFRFGNIEESATYRAGELHGLYKKFYQNRKLQMVAEYKNGKQDGIYRYYDENENIVMEYRYKDGEKVSGGLTGSGN